MWRVCKAHAKWIWNEHDGWTKFLLTTSNKTIDNQSKYTKEILKKFGLEDAKSYSTPMSTTCKLEKDENGKKVDQKFIETWSDHFFTLLLVDLILCTVHVSVQDFKVILENHI